MAVEIDTASDHLDFFDRLIAFLQLGVTSPGGPDWELLDYDSGGASAIFKARGLTDAEEIFVGLSLHPSPSTDAFNLGIWMFRAYVPELAHTAQPGHSTRFYVPLWDTSMPYWFVANGQRLIVTAKVSTVYSSGYAGKFLPYGLPGEYPQPYYVAGVVPGSTTRWSTISEFDRNFWDPGSAARILLPSGAWWTARNHQDVSGTESPYTADVQVWPYAFGSMASSTRDRYRELRENVDGTYPLWPLILGGADPSAELYGELDGAFAVTGFSNAAENIIQIGGVDHLVVQNLFRTARYQYAAIKLE